jgi:hypothetical protein
MPKLKLEEIEELDENEVTQDLHKLFRREATREKKRQLKKSEKNKLRD